MAIYDYREPPQPSGPPPGTTGPAIMGFLFIAMLFYVVFCFVQLAKSNAPF